jgi:dephospho-CoA kinase
MNNKSQIIIGLTGGIATGKSTVTNYFKQKYNFPVIDADILAREAVRINSPIFEQIIQRYGKEVTDQSGNLDRHKLGKIIFNNKLEKSWLESLIHPFVLQCFRQQIRELNHELVIVLAIPLLFEAKMSNLATEIWVVACSFSTQIERLKARNNLSTEDAILRINSQMPLGEKIKLANVVLDNNGSLQYLFQQIDQVVTNRLNL